MRKHEVKTFNYEEKINIMEEVKNVGDRNLVAAKHNINPSTIVGFEKQAKSGTLKKDKQISMIDLDKCGIETDLIEIAKLLKDELSIKSLTNVLIPHLIKKGYKEGELLKLFGISVKQYINIVKGVQ